MELYVYDRVVHTYHMHMLKGFPQFCLIFFFLFSACVGLAQTFNGEGNLPVPPGAPGQTVGITYSDATVTGIGILGTGCSVIENVTLNFTHTWVGDVAIFLFAPSGEVIELSSSNGSSGDNYQVTVFTDNTSQFITQGAPPYNGTFRPEGRQTQTMPPFSNSNPLGTYTFANTFNGINADGDWTLMINDYIAIDVGTLISWSITFTVGGGPAPTVSLGPDVTICPGQSTTLTATVTPAADSYLWSNGSTASTITVAPNTNTTYSVTVTNNECIDSDTIQVIVNPTGVTANAGNDQTICQGSSATLTGSGGGTSATYMWSSGQTGSTISVTPNVTTTYTLTVTNGGCTGTDQVIVNVTPQPIAEAGQNVIICEGQTATLTASGGNQNNQYQWSTGQTGPTIIVTPANTTTYSVTVSINGCTDTDDVQVTVNDAPTVAAGPDVQICAGQSVSLMANGSSGTYQWSSGQSGQTISVSPVVTTTYTVTVTENGCTATDNVVVTVSDIQATVTPDQTICAGSTVTLTASGGSMYLWSNGAVGPSISVSPSSTTTYTVTVSQASCNDQASVTVTVNPLPVAIASDDEIICAGETVVLTASGGSTYLWNYGQTTSSISVSPVTTTNYVVTVTSAGCSSTADVVVTVNPSPNAFAGNDVNICSGENTTLTAIGGPGTYAWSTGESTQSITVTPASTTTYTVTITSTQNCIDSDDVIVTVNPIPVANAGPDKEICEGSTTTLTATGGANQSSYQWSNGATGATITVSPATNTIYTVTVTVAGCSSEDAIEVTVLPAPVASAGADQTVCETVSVQLTATGGGTYLWNTGENAPVINVNPASTTTYTVTVTSSNGCTDTDNVIVFISPTPQANAGPDESICDGESASLTGSGGSIYEWSTGATTSTINVTPTTTTTYQLTVTNPGGCSDTDQVTVEVNAIPVANAGPNAFILAGESATLVASGGGTYLWSTGATTAQIIVTPAVTTTYTVTVTVNGCSDVDDVTVSVNEVPALELGPNQMICEGESVTIDATINGPFDLEYEWNTGQTTSIIVVSPTTTTTYSVTATDVISGVVTSDMIDIIVNSTPEANAGPDQDLCSGNTTTLSATGGTSSSSYMWSTGASGASITVSPTNSITYTVTVTELGCMSEDDVEVTVIAAPIAFAGTDENICAGESVTLTASGGSTYQWSNGSATPTITVSPNGTTTYTLTVTDGNGCTAVDNVIVNVSTGPIADAGPDQNICEGDTIILSGAGGVSYVWSTGATTQNINVNPTTTTSYQLTVTDMIGCTATDVVTVTVNIFPVADAGPNVFIATGQTATLVATGGNMYVWSTGEATSQIIVSPTITTTYSVTVSIGNCADVDDVTVFVNEAPQVDLGPDQTLCSGDTTILDAAIAGSFSYNWSTGASTSTISVTPSASTTYGVTVTDIVSGLFSTDEIVVAVVPVPVVNAGPDVNSCVGENITLTATGGLDQTSYQWSNGASGSSITVSPSINTTYIVTVSVNGCSSLDAVNVTVNLNPTASAGNDQSICSGSSLTLSASGGLLFQWSNGSTAQSIDVQPSITTTYSVTVEDANGCSATDDVLVTVSPVVVADAGIDQQICAGETATLQATAGASFLWSTSEITQSIIVSPPSTTSYQLTVTDVNGCSDTDVVTINVAQVPVVNAGQNAFILPGETVTLDATGGGTYLWNTGETTAQIDVSPAVTTTYTVTVTLNGCDNSDDVTVFVNESPSVDIGPDQTICEGETVTLDATVAGPFNITYSWNNGATTNTINVSPVITTSYSVTITDNTSGKITSDTIFITVINLPLGTPVINGTNQLCEGDLQTYSVNGISGANSYTWSVPIGAIILSGQNTPSIDVDFSTAASGPVQVIVSNSCGSLPASIMQVTIDAAPIITGAIQGQADPCAQATSQYAVDPLTGGETYTWTVSGGAQIIAGQGSTDITVDWNGSSGGNICVTASTNCGTSAPVCLQVVTTNSPSISAGNDRNACGLSTILNGSGSGTWTLVNGPGTSQFANADDPLTNVTVSSGGIYIFKYAFSQNGCFAEDEVEVTFNNNPLILNEVTDCNEFNSHYTVSFDVQGGQSPYSLNNGSFTGNIFTSSPIPSGSISSFQVTDANGCVSQELIFEVNCACISKNDIEIQTTSPLCAGDCNGSISIQTSVSGLNYDFGNGNVTGNPVFNNACSGSVQLIISDANGCSFDTTILINEPLPLEVDLGPDLTIRDGDSITITAETAGEIINYSWSTLDNCIDCNSITILPSNTTIYTVEVTDENMCVATDEIVISIVRKEKYFIPTVFSPNGDNSNDYFIIAAGSDLQEITQMTIFDRWGSKVFEKTNFLPGDLSSAWDGTFKGNAVNPGVYVYFIEAIQPDGDIVRFTGDITVIR